MRQLTMQLFFLVYLYIMHYLTMASFLVVIESTMMMLMNVIAVIRLLGIL